jgi:hypothetical protein
MKKHIIIKKNGKKVTFIGVNHEISMENDQINTLINSNDKILVEENSYLNNNDLIKKLQKEVTDKTTKNIFYKLVFTHQLNRISGWDPRPSYINSTGLYGVEEIIVNNKKINRSNFDYYHSLQDVYNHFVQHVQNEKIKYKYFYNITVDADDKLYKLVQKNKISKKFVRKLHDDLRKDHADYADDFATKTVLPKYKNQNVTIIVGLFHFNNMIKKFKGLM